MRRLPLLLISAFLVAVAGIIFYFWFSIASLPAQQQQVFFQNFAQPVVIVVQITVLLAIILGFIIWIWALIHMLTNQCIQGTDKIVWVIVIVFLNVLGAVLYFCIGPSAKGMRGGAKG